MQNSQYKNQNNLPTQNLEDIFKLTCEKNPYTEMSDEEFESYMAWCKDVDNWKFKYIKSIDLQVREFILDYMTENRDWCREKRIEYLHDRIDSLQNEINEVELKQNEDSCRREIANYYFRESDNAYIRQLKHEINKYKKEIEFFCSDEVDRNRITELDIDRARNTDIKLFIEGDGRRTGNLIFYHSPWRTERTPSFCVYENENTYCDFGTMETGDVIHFVRKLYNMEFIEAIKFLLNKK